MRSPLKRVTRKIKKYIKKKGKKSGKNGGMSNGGIQQYFMDDQDAYSPILSVDVDLLPEDAMPLLVFVNSLSEGRREASVRSDATELEPAASGRFAQDWSRASVEIIRERTEREDFSVRRRRDGRVDFASFG